MRLPIFDEPEPNTAIISVCGRYRYTLSRNWIGGEGIVNFVMLNPSTADANKDDATIRKITSYAKQWGYQGLAVTNLFAWRATDPRELPKVANPIGPENDSHIIQQATTAQKVVVAWGTKGGLGSRNNIVKAALRELGVTAYCLRSTKDGHPEHPLYIPLAKELEPFA